jgi:hypothetical protein
LKPGVVCEGGYSSTPTKSPSSLPTISPSAATLAPSMSPTIFTNAPTQPTQSPTNKAFFLINGAIPYAKALAACKQVNAKARLAVLKSYEANRAAADESSNITAWIGLDDRKSEGHFKWADGSALSTSDNILFRGLSSNPSGDDCVVFVSTIINIDVPFSPPFSFPDWYWKNVNCGSYKAGGVLCEIGYTPAPSNPPAPKTTKPSRSPTSTSEICMPEPDSSKVGCSKKIKLCKARGVNMKWRGTGCPQANPLLLVSSDSTYQRFSNKLN